MCKVVAALACLSSLGYGQNLSTQCREDKQVFKLSEMDRLVGMGGARNPLKSLAVLFLAWDPKVSFKASGPSPPDATNLNLAFKGGRAQPPCAAATVGLLEDQQLQAYQWASNLGQPAALVAGAALASMYELSKDLEPEAGDMRRVSLMKKLGKLLFVSAFALEITCMFVTTVTGTLLLGKGVPNPIAYTPMEMLHRELEFEYLFSRVSFFQGLLNWLSAVAVHQCVPTQTMSWAAKRIKRSTAAAIATMLMYMIAFYNRHMSYYSNYGEMLLRFFHLLFRRYYGDEFRILPMLALVPLSVFIKYAFSSLGDLRNEK